MKYSPEELKEILEQAPTDEKGRPIISDEDFMDNLKELPAGTKSESGKVANNGGYLDPGKKGDPKTISNCSKAGKAAQAANAERRKIAETIDLFLKSVDKETGKTMQEKIMARARMRDNAFFIAFPPKFCAILPSQGPVGSGAGTE